MDFDYGLMPAINFVVAIGVAWLGAQRVLSLSKISSHAWRKFVERIALEAVVCIAAVVAAGRAFNAIALYRFRAENPPPGAKAVKSNRELKRGCWQRRRQCKPRLAEQCARRTFAGI